MIPIVEDAILGTDLNGDFHDLLNINALVPVPIGLVTSDDPRLTDARAPLPGSVTNDTVAASAAIDQSKLNLNGQIPSAWLGVTAATAAQGNLAEYLSRKGQSDGYCELDATGKVPAARLPGTTGTGTVTSVGLTMPAQFSVTGSPVTTAGTLAAAWAPVSDLSWFGNKQGASGPPQFYTTPLPVSLIPDLDAIKVTSGMFAPARLPLAIGLGGSHAPGAVPDPGDGTGGALATDYLARDMSFKPAPTVGPTYQPTIPNPVINATTNVVGAVTATITKPASVLDAIVFYSKISASANFLEFPSTGYAIVEPAQSIWVYLAHSGYNNSGIVQYTNPNV